jgi:hypothetical protein
MQRRKKKQITNKAMKKAIRASQGKVYLAAMALRCSPSTIYRRANEVKKIQSLIDSLRGQMVDEAENQLWIAVKSGKAWAVCFALKCLGKDRGYVERQETRIEGSMNSHVHHDAEALRAAMDEFNNFGFEKVIQIAESGETKAA